MPASSILTGKAEAPLPRPFRIRLRPSILPVTSRVPPYKKTKGLFAWRETLGTSRS